MSEALFPRGYVPDALRRSCYDCQSCQTAMSWWCVDPEAIEYRGTSLSGVTACPFWKPVKTADQVPWWRRWFYVRVEVPARGDWT